MDLLPKDLELAHLKQVGQVEQRLHLRLVQHLLHKKRIKFTTMSLILEMTPPD